MLWFLAMLAIAPAMRGWQMWRTWAALAGASAAAWIVPDIVAYVIIDLIAAAIVVRHPRGLAQKAIGWLFVSMLLFEVGFILSPQNNPMTMWQIGVVLGWAQWGLLLSWGLYDRVGLPDSWLGNLGSALAYRKSDR